MRRCIVMGILLCAGFLVGNSAYGQEENLPPEATVDCPERLIFLLDEKFPGENRGTAPGDCRVYKYGYGTYSKLNRYGNPGSTQCGPVLGPSAVKGQIVQILPKLSVCDETNTADTGGWCPGVTPRTDQNSPPADRSTLEAAGRSSGGPFIIDPSVVSSNENAAFRLVDCGATTPRGVDPAECGAGQLAVVWDDDAPGECSTAGTACRLDADCPGAETCGASFTIGFGLKFNQNGNAGTTRCVAGGNLCSTDADCAGADVCELASGDTICCQSVVPGFCPNVVGFGDYPDLNRPVNLPVVDRLQQAPQIHSGGRGSGHQQSQTFVLTDEQTGQTVQLEGRCSDGGCQDDTSLQNFRPLQNGCTGSRKNFTTPCGLIEVAQGNDPCNALDAHPNDTCFNTFVDDNFSGNHKPCASDADCDAGDTCDTAFQPDVCTFAEIGNRVNSSTMLPDSNPNPGVCNWFPVYLVGNEIDLSPGGTGRSTDCGLAQWYHEGIPGQDADVNAFFTSDLEGDPQPGCQIKLTGSFIRVDADCDGVDDAVPDLCPRLSELNTTLDTNLDGIGDECQCGDVNKDGAVTGIDIGGAAICANDGTTCDPTQSDADGDGSVTATDIGGIVAVVNGNAATSDLRCARNL